MACIWQAPGLESGKVTTKGTRSLYRIGPLGVWVVRRALAIRAHQLVAREELVQRALIVGALVARLRLDERFAV
jgi:hypothetical protein